MSGDDKLSHRPFSQFSDELKQAVKDREQVDDPPPPPPPPKRAAGARETVERPSAEDDGRLFQREMLGVRPLDGRGNYVPQERQTEPPPADRDEAEVMAQLADLVEGRAAFDFSATDEHIEGLATGLDKRLLRRLRQGYFSVQGHLDLHGKTRQEARPLVEQFVLESRRLGRRCVLIVHGRGLNSKDQIPVLKESLKVWLAKGRIARSVLGFCSAQPTDGGGGAVYVLLRK